MLPQLLLGSFLVIITCTVHSAVTVFVIRLNRALHVDHRLIRTLLGRTSLVAGIVLLLFLAALIEATIWAWTYLRVGAIEGLEAALYFSMVTFTTLGYGDVVLDSDWRLLASFQAAIGIIMFGWTTAIIVALIQRMVQAQHTSTTAG